MRVQRISDEQLARVQNYWRQNEGVLLHEVLTTEIATGLDLIDARAEIARLKEALVKINQIRNSIIGLQTINWSEHIYPLVAALNEAGCEGMSYDEAQGVFGTMLERTNQAEEARADIQSRYDAILAERAGVSEAFRFNTPTDALYNLEGALCDLGQMEADPICRTTIRRVIKQLSPLRAALSTPIPTPVDREAIRAEALEEAAKIANAEAADADRQIAENDAYCERIGRRSSFAPGSANESCRSRRIHAKSLAEKIRSAAKTEAK